MLRTLKRFLRRPAPANRTPAIAAGNILPAGAEPFEWPDFGDGEPDVDAFIDWCMDVDVDAFESINSMRIAHDEFACLTGRQALTNRKLACLIKHCDRIEKWRDRQAGNATRYRIVAPRNVVPFHQPTVAA